MPETPLQQLVGEGLLRREGERLQTTRRWQGAMARAALRLSRAGAEVWDLRLPIASALIELHPELSDHDVAALVDAMLPIEARALGASR